MKRTLITALLAGVLLLAHATPSHAVISFTQLDETTFTVSHRIKGFGSRGKATRMVYTKTASLCIAAGFTHYQILSQESEAGQQYQAANASVTVRFFFEDGANRISCESAADPVYVEDARAKLDEQGYETPEPMAPALASGPAGASPCPQECTIAQIAAMARSGLSDDQIVAACGGEAEPTAQPADG